MFPELPLHSCYTPALTSTPVPPPRVTLSILLHPWVISGSWGQWRMLIAFVALSSQWLVFLQAPVTCPLLWGPSAPVWKSHLSHIPFLTCCTNLQFRKCHVVLQSQSHRSALPSPQPLTHTHTQEASCRPGLVPACVH